MNAADINNSFRQKIISLGPAITENIYLLGIQDRLIANTTFCKYPLGAEKKIKIGNMTKMNVEKIYSLQPGLVLCTSLSDPDQIKKLQYLKIKTYTFSQAKNFKEMCGHLLKLGELTGEQEKAKKIILQAAARVDLLRKNIKNKTKPRVFIQIGSRPLFTVTKDSFINDFISFAGGINITAAASSGMISREKILQLNPDIILITSMGIEAGSEKNKWQKYKDINAVKNNRIYIIDSYKLCSPTIVTFADTLKEIIGILHKGSKNE